MYYKFRNPSQTEQSSEGNRGVLKVEVPHWAAEVRIFNCLLQPETEIGKIKSDARTKSGYSLEAVLEPGAYQVQTSLEGKSESEWIPVAEGKITQVSPKAWENLKFTSAAPINDIDNSNKTHSDKAAELSRQSTWQYQNGGNSRLFLFVRTLDPKIYGETFSDGLEIWNANGEVVTDFSDSIKKDRRQGWMAFNADLPSGGYILRRGRSGVRLRYQVFYLCDGWETQIFLKARRFPSLSTWSVNMARRGNGFRSNSEAILAAEVITDNLRYSSNSFLLLQNEKIKEAIDILLDEKMENPWLGILAAHAIMRLQEQTENLQLQMENLNSRKKSDSISDSKQIEKEIFEGQQYVKILENKVKPFINRVIGDHPDVRALLLSNNSMAEQPFDFPPSLLTGLLRVQTHSLKFADTIPLDSLTDYVIDDLVSNAPWTAWRQLSQQPKQTLISQNHRRQIKQSLFKDFSVSSVLSQTAVSRTPVYHLAESGGVAQKQKSSTETVLRDAPMIQKAKEIVIDYAKNFEMGGLPEKINLNSAEEIHKVLAQVTPEEISQNFGIPLSRTEESLKFLHSQNDASWSDVPEKISQTGKSLVTVQHAILEYALSKFGKSESETTGAGRTQAKYTIREIVNKINSEADRLFVAANNNAVRQSLEISFDNSFNFAERLYATAEILLKHADFVLITDEHGKILYSNGAFLLYISPKSAARAKADEQEINDLRLSKQRSWELILNSTQYGLSEVENPHEPEDWRNWKLSRTEIEDQATNRSVSYLNLLRLVGFPPLNEEILQAIDSTTANLTFYAPLLIYSSEDTREVNEEKLRETIEHLEKQVK